ncbi:MAG: hypothetical protein HC875_20755 [Anaerolineales bacterium]|nr:hypothetical protein [Anaerolineales bacterium]
MIKDKKIETSYQEIKNDKFKLDKQKSKIFEPQDNFVIDIDESDLEEEVITQQVKPSSFHKRVVEFNNTLDQLEQENLNVKIAQEAQSVLNASSPEKDKNLKGALNSFSQIKNLNDQNQNQIVKQTLTNVKLLDLIDQIEEELPENSKVKNKIQSISKTLKIDNRNLGQTIQLFCRELQQESALDLPWNNPILLISKLVREREAKEKEIAKLKEAIKNLIDKS